MRTELQKKAKEFRGNSKIRNYWKKAFRPLAVITVFFTTYVLILPAITMEGNAICGFSEHSHSETCYEQVIVENLICGFHENEMILHSHDESCYDDEGNLVCPESENSTHIHDESCYEKEIRENLICEKDEHIHIESCYSASETNSHYLCGMGVHSHTETCYDEMGVLGCSIPEHSHEAACVLEEVDSSADTETEEDWRAELSGITLSGNWAKDILAVAESQLGYCESTENVVLAGNELKGYTRYGEKYGDPYGDWSAMFVSFCAEYAGIKDFEISTDMAGWSGSVAGQQMLAPEGFVPESGDIVFIDTDSNEVPELAGIVSGKVSETDKIEIIAGDTENDCVEYLVYDLADAAILGYCKLPENPMMEEEIDFAAKTAEMIAALPSAEEAKEKLAEFNRILDEKGYSEYFAELEAKIATAKEAFDVLTEEQKIIVGDVSVFGALEAVLGEAEWKELSVLTEEKAFLFSFNTQIPEGETVGIEQNALFGFTAEIKTYSEEQFGEARIKLEFVLPLSVEQATFDLEEMPWLEEAELKTEKRIIGEEEKDCQVLTGYKRLKATTVDETVVPGSFSENIAVKVLDMEHNAKFGLVISAAMEYNAWEGICEIHGANEKITVETQSVTVSAIASEEDQEAEYKAILVEYEEITASGLSEEELKNAAEVLWNKISEKCLEGKISEEAFNELSEKVAVLIYGDLDSVAEAAVGYNWKLLQESGWFEEYNDADGALEGSFEYSANGFAYTANSDSSVFTAADNGTASSDSQIREEGGDAVSSEGSVYVSKTIEGTETENVFDITLEIITQDVVTEIYKEPDMAVVIVMDISQTMNSNFGSSTRYKAAMTAAENFIDQFAENNLGASSIGFVAFNSDAHQIFAMSQCSTASQATNLKNTMRTATGNIINASGYESSKKRFTNIEAGLKCGWDLLNTVDNEHKYVIFLSDGFPTTYIQSGYVGYDTYDTNGTRFYDSVEKYGGKNRPCSYGTSYSDEAAIRARKIATTIKNGGGTIFSVGVDIGGQTIKYYVDAFAGRSFSVVDRRNTNYEIGSASDANAFKNWLGTSIGSGNGYYYDSTNTAGLTDAFDKIFERITELNAESSHLDWVANDPMGNMGVHEQESVEFIGFFDKAGTLVEGNLYGESKDGAQYENTASFNTETATIYWDLKQSGYISTVVGNMTNYRCTLKYRVRLQNEKAGFVEYQSYDTNDVTSLTYRVIEQNGSKVEVSERRSVDFQIPAVEGYLAELAFNKQDSYGKAVPGAEFTLSHDTDSCGFCRGDGKSHVSVEDIVAVSGTDGRVGFTNIPSGHTYILSETMVPEGYKATENIYKVKVSYDDLTVTVTDSEGNPVTWEEVIENYTAYRLPETGGSGTVPVTFGGILIIAACVYYVFNVERKFRKEDKS